MTFRKLLIANRGEIAIRIARAAEEMGIVTVAVHGSDDATSLHVRRADEVVALPGSGAAAYLDIDALVDAARRTHCDAVHPGYGFLSESAAFARAVSAAGLTFIGPDPASLDLFGDKLRAKALARDLGVPVAEGTQGTLTDDDARAFMARLGPGARVLVKALAGGGGRGMRVVGDPDELANALERSRSEAAAAFGDGSVYLERMLPGARHIEIQIVGDGSSATHLWERECTLQRRHQKLVEMAPSPSIDTAMRDKLIAASLAMARKASYRGLGTFEFLVAEDDDGRSEFIFIECNPRLQVEHTVTEEVTGIDLVRVQIRLAQGETLADIGLDATQVPPLRGAAVQLRVNLETVAEDGTTLPSSGTLTAFEVPAGPGVRVDTFGYAGYVTSTRFDPLLAKVIAFSPDGHAAAMKKAARALSEFRIVGVDTNVGFLRRLLAHPDVVAGRLHTRFIEEQMGSILACGVDPRERTFSAPVAGTTVHLLTGPVEVAADGSLSLRAPMPGIVIALPVEEGQYVRKGAELVLIEAMKSELAIRADSAGVVRRILVEVGENLRLDQQVALIDPQHDEGADETAGVEVDLDAIRPDLAEVLARKHELSDAARPDAVTKRHVAGNRTARENIADLCDEDSFVEYGGMILALQRGRRSIDELKRVSPADGLVAGMGSVNGALFGEERTRCAVLAYDYTVFAGTQGFQAHEKKDRLFELADRYETPVVMFTEGGGGRPGDTDFVGVAGLDMRTFWHFGRLSAKVPLVGVNSGRCFAGNAALLGSCDVIIATKNSTIGMAGPAMIEAGGLGAVSPEEVGPVSVQAPNGVIDILVDDEPAAVRAAKHYLSFFQGRTRDWTSPDQRLLRSLVPENRLRIYDIRPVLETLADAGSLLELRRAFAPGMITALMRIEGRPLGVIANNPMHLGGAIDAPGADKAARFMQLCDAFDIPLVSLCDTPGFMVGPESEKTATVRHFSRLFLVGANLDIPLFAIVLRKAYGLGAVAMTGGTFAAPMFSVAWPTGEVGPMGLEGAVRLAYRKELEAISDLAERDAAFKRYVAEMYAQGKAMNAATFMELDDVIDPAETRRWIVQGLKSAGAARPRQGKKRPFVDAW